MRERMEDYQNQKQSEKAKREFRGVMKKSFNPKQREE